MLAGTYNITCEQGSTFNRVVTLKYPDPNDASVYLLWDFTGYTARMQIRRTIESPTVMIELTTANNGITFTNAIGGELTIQMTAVQTAGLVASTTWKSSIVILRCRA